VTGAIVSDLLSDVLANGAPGYIWVTIQAHRNVAAVASAQELAAVVITAGRRPNDDLVNLAESEGVAILATDESSYQVAGRLYALGVR
jgi:predicted transcriptional regulator